GCAAPMPCDCTWNVDALHARSHAAQPQIDVFEIRLEAFVKSVQFRQYFPADQARGRRRDGDSPVPVATPRSRFAAPRSPGTARAADQIVSSVDAAMIRGVHQGAG